MCSGSEAGSYLRLIDFVYHSTLGLRVIKKKSRTAWSRYTQILNAVKGSQSTVWVHPQNHTLVYQVNGSNGKPMAPTCVESSDTPQEYYYTKITIWSRYTQIRNAVKSS